MQALPPSIFNLDIPSQSISIPVPGNKSDTVGLTWAGLEPLQQVENPVTPDSANYTAEVTLTKGIININAQNSSEFPAFDIGDVVLFVGDSNTNFYTAIGKDGKEGDGDNVLPKSFFNDNGVFREQDYIDSIVTPISTMMSYLEQYYGLKVNLNINFTNLDPAINGAAHPQSNVCTETNSPIRIDIATRDFINPLSPDAYKFDRRTLAQLDYMRFGVVPHEAFHAFMHKYGLYAIPAMRIGNEAAANAFKLDAMVMMGNFFVGPKPGEEDSAFDTAAIGMAQSFWDLHTIDMSDTGTYKSGYEQASLFQNYMQIYPMNWPPLFSRLSQFDYYCNPSGYNPTLLEYLFNQSDTVSLPHAYMVHLGMTLYNVGGPRGNIYDRIRKGLTDDRIITLGSGNGVSLVGKTFYTFKATEIPNSDEVLIFNADESMSAVALDSLGHIIEIEPGKPLPVIPGEPTRFIVYNTGANPGKFKLEKQIFDYRLYAPGIYTP